MCHGPVLKFSPNCLDKVTKDVIHPPGIMHTRSKISGIHHLLKKTQFVVVKKSFFGPTLPSLRDV